MRLDLGSKIELLFARQRPVCDPAFRSHSFGLAPCVLRLTAHGSKNGLPLILFMIGVGLLVFPRSQSKAQTSLGKSESAQTTNPDRAQDKPNSTVSTSSFSKLDIHSTAILSIPALSKGKPAAGKRVNVITEEYAGTNVFHTIYLPETWSKSGPQLPIIFEYTGNYHPPSGSTGKVEDAALGYGLSGGKYIWVSLPYVNKENSANKENSVNQVTWWGDEKATIEYAKTNVPRIIKEFSADPNAVILCGFSRGAIGTNYLGLHDDEIAKLWTAFVTHDHFDGLKEWRGTQWGSPLDKYRAAAIARLERVNGRPYLVSQNGNVDSTAQHIRSSLKQSDNFTYNKVNTKKILGDFPNQIAKHPHTDKWLFKPSPERTKVWNWMNEATRKDDPEFANMFASGDFQDWQVGKKGAGWSIKDGIVHLHKIKSGSLRTRKKYKNFELKFEWKISEGGNSGVIYRVQKGRGLEYQILDDEKHIRGKNPIWSAAAIYDLAEADTSKRYNPAGQWNSSRIVADKFRIEHWLNGKKVAELRTEGKDWDARYKASKYPKYNLENFANVPSPIIFQDHGAQVWYRNVLIKELGN